MGEAKRRNSAADASGFSQSGEFGRGVGKWIKKGLVISPPVEVCGRSILIKSSILDPQELRCAALLWDKLVWPSSRTIYIGGGRDEQFLEQQGFLLRPDYTFEGDVAQGYVSGQIAAFNDLERKEPGVWSLAQGENTLLIKSGALIKAGYAQLKLTQAIPVPDKDVPLAEVFDFRDKRRDELLQLRLQIDALISRLNGSEGNVDEIFRLVSEVDKACADAIKVGREWRFPVRLTNLKASYKIHPIKTVAGVLATVFGGQQIGLPVSQAILAAVTVTAAANVTALELSFDGFEWRGLRPRQGPYRYVFSFHNELF